MYQRVKCNCSVSCFVDQNVKRDFYVDVPIISYDDSIRKECGNIPIIVTDYAYHEVRSMLISAGKSNIMSIDDFFMKGKGSFES